jgi:cytochrome c-type biogenesis protein CcmH/NrfF
LRNLFRKKQDFFYLVGLLLLVPALSVADSDHEKAVGYHLMCICGCQQVLTECNHNHCPSSVPMRKEVSEKLASGMTDDQVLKSFVEKYGTVVLAAPGRSGLFNIVAWSLTFVVLLAGGVGLIVHLRHIKSAEPPASPTTIEASAYDRKIEDELNRFNPED